MAVVHIADEKKTIDDVQEATAYLAALGIAYERWEPAHPVSADAPGETILAAYADEIEKLKQQGGYVTADVIDLCPSTPDLDTLLNKFNTEHWHDEDEVRFIIEGRGVFHIHVAGKPVVAIQVGPGDLIRVPRGTHHWFDLCEEQRIRCIRLFQDAAGWTPHYTASGVDQGYVPVCLGPTDIPIQLK